MKTTLVQLKKELEEAAAKGRWSSDNPNNRSNFKHVASEMLDALAVVPEESRESIYTKIVGIVLKEMENRLHLSLGK